MFYGVPWIERDADRVNCFGQGALTSTTFEEESSLISSSS